jgi:hypothetical protein
MILPPPLSALRTTLLPPWYGPALARLNGVRTSVGHNALVELRELLVPVLPLLVGLVQFLEHGCRSYLRMSIATRGRLYEKKLSVFFFFGENDHLDLEKHRTMIEYTPRHRHVAHLFNHRFFTGTTNTLPATSLPKTWRLQSTVSAGLKTRPKRYTKQ